MKPLTLKERLLSPTLFLLAAAAVVLTLFGVSRALGKTVDVDDFDCFGTLKVQSLVYCSKKSERQSDDLQNVNVKIEKKLFEDGQSGEKTEKPIYSLFPGAFEVENGKTFAVLSFDSNKKPDLSQSVDFSKYKTRTALQVLTESRKETGFVIYRCIDKLGDTDVFYCRFESRDDGSKSAAKLFMLSKAPVKPILPSEAGFCGSFELGENQYSSAPKNGENDLFEKGASVGSNDGWFRFEKTKIKNPRLLLKENAFCKRRKKDAVIMYYVGSAWDKTNSVYLPECESSKAYDITDENGEKSGFVVYVLEIGDGQKEFYLARFNYDSDYPSFSRFFSRLQKHD